MPFTKEQLESINQALRQKSRLMCPSCGEKGWTLSNELVIVPSFIGGALNTGGLPGLAVICNTCGNMQFFNAFKLGIADIFGLKASEGGENA